MSKILIYGDGAPLSYERSVLKAIREKNIECSIFDEPQEYLRLLKKVTGLFFNNRKSREVIHRVFWKAIARPLQKLLIDAALRTNANRVFVSKGFFLHPSTITALQSHNIAVSCYYADNPFNTWHFTNSNTWVRESIKLYDTYFIWAKFLIPRLKLYGAKSVYYIPYACNPEVHYPIPVGAQDRAVFGSDVAFIGTADKERINFFSQLIKKKPNFTFKIWGGGWGKAPKILRAHWMGREVIAEDFSRVCNATKIIINHLRKQHGPAHTVKTFEIPACGGFAISSRTEEHVSFFPEGYAMEHFSDHEELLKKIQYYLSPKNEEARLNIARRAHEISKDHSIKRQVDEILSVL